MKPRELAPGIRSVGAVDWDRRMFDMLIPLPQGTSYNSYLVTGAEKTALFDTVDPTMTAVLFEHLGDLQRLDYVVVQHVEQDHSGSLPAVLARFPGAQVLCSSRAVDMLATHVHVSGDIVRAVADGEEVDLGGKTLRFLYTPWAHWPETMSTFIPEDGVLLSCDMFGSHLATSDLIGDEEEIQPAAKRYFAEIMMPFGSMLRKNLEKVEPLGARLIGPSHGPVYGRPQLAFDLYREWIDGPPHNLVLIPYVSMHGSTKVMVDRLEGALVDRGIKVERLDLQGADLGRFAFSLVDAATIVAGAPTVLQQPHPLMRAALMLADELKPKARFFSALVSYGWATKALESMIAAVADLKAELVEPVVVKGLPTAEDLASVDALAAAIAAKHAEAGLV